MSVFGTFLEESYSLINERDYIKEFALAYEDVCNALEYDDAFITEGKLDDIKAKIIYLVDKAINAIKNFILKIKRKIVECVSKLPKNSAVAKQDVKVISPRQAVFVAINAFPSIYGSGDDFDVDKIKTAEEEIKDRIKQLKNEEAVVVHKKEGTNVTGYYLYVTRIKKGDGIDVFNNLKDNYTKALNMLEKHVKDFSKFKKELATLSKDNLTAEENLPSSIAMQYAKRMINPILQLDREVYNIILNNLVKATSAYIGKGSKPEDNK